MQMIEPGRSIDVFRMPGRSRYATVERLSNLADNDHFVDRSGSKGPENLAPRCCQGLVQRAKKPHKFWP
jgi:hypothetical protein